MLISTRVKLGLLQVIDMPSFLEHGICDEFKGVREVRHFTANNAHIDRFDPSQKTTFNALYDVTKTYVRTMQIWRL